MEKVTRSKSFISLLALFFAFLLFLNANAQNNSDGIGRSLSKTSQVVLTNVPIVLKYDSNAYYVSGYEETANVTLISANRVLLDTEANPQTRNFSLIADLTQLGEGTHEVPLSIVNLSRSVSAEFEPREIYVTIEKKAMVEMPVSFSLGMNQLKEDYSIEKTTIKPNMIEVTSGENTIKSITQVVAVLPANKVIDGNLSDTAEVYALDKDGNRVSADLSPNKVTVNLEVKAPSKVVPIRFRQVGDYAKGVKNIVLDPNRTTVELFGPREVLDTIYYVDVDVDISGIKTETKQEITLPTLEHVTHEPHTVEVFIRPELEEKRDKEEKSVSNDEINRANAREQNALEINQNQEASQKEESEHQETTEEEASANHQETSETQE